MRVEVPYASPTACLGNSYPNSDDDSTSNSSGTRPYGMSSSASSCESRIRPLGAPKSLRGDVQPLKFKTQMCGHYVRGEACPYNPWCAFAHGEAELRSVEGNIYDGVQTVNTLPRALVYHESWVQTTKYTRKTGPAAAAVVSAPPPRPSFMQAAAKKPVAPTVRVHNPYGACVIAPAMSY